MSCSVRSASTILSCPPDTAEATLLLPFDRARIVEATAAKGRAGLTMSTAPVDFGVGSAELNVLGVTTDGTDEPIVTDGDWGFMP